MSPRQPRRTGTKTRNKNACVAAGAQPRPRRGCPISARPLRNSGNPTDRTTSPLTNNGNNIVGKTRAFLAGKPNNKAKPQDEERRGNPRSYGSPLALGGIERFEYHAFSPPLRRFVISLHILIKTSLASLSLPSLPVPASVVLPSIP